MSRNLNGCMYCTFCPLLQANIIYSLIPVCNTAEYLNIYPGFFFGHFQKNSGPKKTQVFRQKLRFLTIFIKTQVKNRDFRLGLLNTAPKKLRYFPKNSGFWLSMIAGHSHKSAQTKPLTTYQMYLQCLLTNLYTYLITTTRQYSILHFPREEGNWV